MKIATVIARVLLGLIFVMFGSNAFLHFLPMAPLPQGLAGLYVRAFIESGYVYVIGALQVISGLLLLIGRFVPFALTILGAIIFNILVFRRSHGARRLSTCARRHSARALSIVAVSPSLRRSPATVI